MMVMIVGIQLFEFHFVIVVTFFFFFLTENKTVHVEFGVKIQQVWTFLSVSSVVLKAKKWVGGKHMNR